MYDGAGIRDPFATLRVRVKELASSALVSTVAGEFRDELMNPCGIAALAEAGFLGMCLPPHYGGGGQDYRALAVLCEELGRVDTAHQITVTVHLALVALAILQWGTEEQRDRWLPQLASGDRFATFALTEPGTGSDVGALIASAKRDGDGWILNGEKAWISHADLADTVLVFATGDPSLRHRGITAFLVDTGTPGLTSTRYRGKLGIRAGSTGSLVMQDVRVGPDALLGREGEGFAVALAALGNGLYTVGAGAVGVAQAALDATVAMLRDDSIVGSPGPPPEWLAARLSVMASGVERARLLINQAGDLKNRGQPSARETSLAKWQAAEIASESCLAALEVRDTLGLPADQTIERMLANVKGSVIFGGTREIHTGMQGAYALGYRIERPFRCPAPTASDLAGL
ncbi:MAG TPA: acyl-CoA dehydrogenase family protein [Thermomicrobiaceae bacterium]|nr:acyl-CoA dehydrogenase family protein [Thermomicrobiaceae bacterium]